MANQREQAAKRPIGTISEKNKPNIDLIARSLISIYARQSGATKK
jgi:hypothetical protein